MAHYFEYADKDATLIRGAREVATGSQKNTGMDEILEVGKKFESGTTSFNEINRAVIQFDVSTISASVAGSQQNGGLKIIRTALFNGSTNENADGALFSLFVQNDHIAELVTPPSSSTASTFQ